MPDLEEQIVSMEGWQILLPLIPSSFLVVRVLIIAEWNLGTILEYLRGAATSLSPSQAICEILNKSYNIYKIIFMTVIMNLFSIY